MKKVRVLLWGDAVIETGFARVLHSIAKYLPTNYDISWIGVNYKGDPHPYPYRIYPPTAILKDDFYGIMRAKDILTVENPDLIFILNDAWIQDVILQNLKKIYKDKVLPKIITYTPVDAKDHNPSWYHNFDIVTQAVCYTEFGKVEILKAAPELADRLVVIPHGIDTEVFFQKSQDKATLKKQVYTDRADFVDGFVVLNANRNQPRKRIDISMKAFKLFADGKPENVKLHLHTGMADAHIDLEVMSKRLGIGSRIVVSNMKNGAQVIPASKLNLIYNATDVGLNTGLGEGWGLTAMEHAITGAPQVVSDHSALREIYADCGLLVPTITDYTLDGIMTTGGLVRAEDVAAKLELLYADHTLYTTLSQKAMEKFSLPMYQWENISQRFAKIFEDTLHGNSVSR
jgi:D-inositol-3-phosphate glycosyltransferase